MTDKLTGIETSPGGNQIVLRPSQRFYIPTVWRSLFRFQTALKGIMELLWESRYAATERAESARPLSCSKTTSVQRFVGFCLVS